MWKQKIGISLGYGYNKPLSEVAEIVAKTGFDAISPAWKRGEELYELVNEARARGLIIQSLHAPFTKSADMWRADEEKAKADQEAANAALQKELEDLRNERNIAKYAAALGGSDIGMDADTANEVASALNAGETEKVFDGIRRFIASHDKAMAEKAIMNNPKLPGGSSTKTVTKEEFKQMGLREMAAFKQEHPDLYMEYTKKT